MDAIDIEIDDFIINDVYIYDQYVDSVNYEILKLCENTWKNNMPFDLNKLNNVFEICNFESVFVWRVLVILTCEYFLNIAPIPGYVETVKNYIMTQSESLITRSLFTETELESVKYEIMKMTLKLSLSVARHGYNVEYNANPQIVENYLMQATHSLDYQFCIMLYLVDAIKFDTNSLGYAILLYSFCKFSLGKENLLDCNRYIYNAFIVKIEPFLQAQAQVQPQ